MTPPPVLLLDTNLVDTRATMKSVAIHAELVSSNATKKATDKKPFQQFQQTYGPVLELENTHDSQQQAAKYEMTAYDDELEVFDVDGASIWDALASLSMLFLWFQRYTFGAVGLMRSLVLGHCLQLLFRAATGSNSSSNINSNDSNISLDDPINEKVGVRKYFYLMQSLLFGTVAGGHGLSNNSSGSQHKQVNGAWPPPALVALAILTMLALIVHPDGMTWIVLRKLRDSLASVLQSSTTCWAVMIRDYGVLGTVSASASITLVLVLAIAMHKAFLSNCCGSYEKNTEATKRTPAEKKRRRRKGNRGRIKGTNSNPSSSPPCPRLPKVEEVASDGACDSRSSSEVPHTNLEDGKSPISQDCDDPQPPHHEAEGASIVTSPSALESVVSEDYSLKGRMPVPSVCTVDTAAMSDDISCDSFSVRSAQQQPVRQANSRASKSKRKATRGGNANNKASRGKKQLQQSSVKVTPVTPTTKTRVENVKPGKQTIGTSGLATESASIKYDQFQKNNGQKRNTGAGKGRTASTQNARGSRGKNGRATKNQKNQPAIQTPPAFAPKTATFSTNPKITAIPATVKNKPTLPNGSPIAELKQYGSNSHGITENSAPFSPCSHSLFSCENGASGWSLPALPVVSQPKSFESAKMTSLTPSLSYQSNPFAMSHCQTPTDPMYSGRTTPVVHSEQFGLWSSGQPGTPSTVASTVVSTTDTKQAVMTTPKRPLRAPPGLPTPPGFTEAHLSHPILANSSDLFTPIHKFEKSSFIPTSPTIFRSPDVVSSATPQQWSSMSLGDTGSTTFSKTTPTSNPLSGIQRNLVKENPFAEHADEAECRIEAELQELGGRMIGSVLDF